MTTETEIKLPEPVGYLDENGGYWQTTTSPEELTALFTEDQVMAHARAAVKADRQDHVENDLAMVPSDDDLLGCAGVTRNGGLPSIIGTADIRRFADCVRKHFGSRPGASAEASVILGALFDLVNVLRKRHYGRMPDEVREAYERAWAIVFSSPAKLPSAPVAQEPVQLAWRVVDRETGIPHTDWIDGDGGDQSAEPVFSGGLIQRAYAAPVAAQAQKWPDNWPDQLKGEYQQSLKDRRKTAQLCAQDREDMEHMLALKEAGCNAASDSYFGVRPSLPETIETRMLFEDGFDRGYDAARAAKEPDRG
ncbi:MAG TPA: hypothetical protein VF285_11340 [Castellaniella sp.]|uniref:hypothetical protein n=1 Tax=Castellaniella sp. TaxID=1955812 RepID=UPI002EE8F7A2